MGAVRQLNLGIKVNGKEVEETFKSVTSQMYKLRREVNGTKEGTKDWEKANQELAKVEAKRKGMIDRQKEFRKEVAGTTEETREGTAAMQGFGQSAGQVLSGLASGDLVAVQEGLRGMRAGIMGATKAAIAFIATPLGATLAAIALAVAAVTQYFRDSEEGQNAWNKITAVTGVVVGNLTDLLSDLGGILVDVFTKPKQTWDNFVDSLESGYNFIKGQVYDRLIAETDILVGSFEKKVLKMRIAWNELTRDSEEEEKLRLELEKVDESVEKSTELINKKNQELKDLAQGVVNSAKSVGAEMAKEAARSAQLSKLEAKADKIERDLIVERGNVEAQVAEARLKARDEEKYSATERKQFLQEAVDMQNGLLDKEIQAAKIRADIKTEQNEFSKSGKEDFDEEARLIAQVDALRRKKAEAERTMVRDQIRVDGELRKAQSAGNSDREKAEAATLQELNKLEEEYNKKAVERLADTNLKKAQLDRDRAVAKAEALGASEELMAKIRAAHQVKIDEEKAAEEEKELERLRGFEARKRELENELDLARAETKEEKDAIKHQQALEKEQEAYEKRIEKFQEEMELLQLNEEEKNQVLESIKEAHEQTVLGIQKKYTDEKIRDEERLNAAKKQLWNDSLNAAINLAGSETKVGQALLLAKEIMAARETAIQLGLFQNKMTLNAAEAGGDIAAGTAKTASVGFPQNIPLLIGFAAQVSGIIGAIMNATKGKAQVKKSFAKGGYTDLFGMGYKDETGHEPAGVVHKNEYVVPEIVRQDPAVPPILNYLETKRKKKLGLYADGGDVEGNHPLPGGPGNDNAALILMLERFMEKLDQPLEALIYFDMEAELKRQEQQKKLEKIQNRSKIKTV